MEKETGSAPAERNDEGTTDPEKDANQRTGDRIFVAVMVLLIAGVAYGIVFWLIPACKAVQLKNEQAQAATVQGPPVLKEMLEEMKKMRVVLERIAPALEFRNFKD